MTVPPRWRRAVLLLSVLAAACGSRARSRGGEPETSTAALEPKPKPKPKAAAAVLAPLGTFGSLVQAPRYRATLEKIARPRPPGSAHWRVVQSLCQETLVQAGFDVQLHRYATGINVVGTLAGEVDETVVVGAHYDHIPGCDGADDNASGVAGALELARVLATARHHRTLRVACWDEEERGLVGSRAWTNRLAERDGPVTLYLNFDAIGFATDAPETQTLPAGFEILFADQVAELVANQWRANFIAVIADAKAGPAAEVFASAAAELALPVSVLEVPALLMTVPLAVDLRRSDHASFWDRGVPSLMITDTANFRSPAYHCERAPDDVTRVNFAFATSVVRAAAETAAHALDVPTAPAP